MVKGGMLKVRITFGDLRYLTIFVETKTETMNKTHCLKTIQPYFDRCWEQTKTFEVRKNDRDFQAGDTVILQEYNPENNTYTGRELRCCIMYVLYDFDAIEKGYVVFSLSFDEYIGNK